MFERTGYSALVQEQTEVPFTLLIQEMLQHTTAPFQPQSFWTANQRHMVVPYMPLSHNQICTHLSLQTLNLPTTSPEKAVVLSMRWSETHARFNIAHLMEIPEVEMAQLYGAELAGTVNTI